jgi:hypothetical protein
MTHNQWNTIRLASINYVHLSLQETPVFPKMASVALLNGLHRSPLETAVNYWSLACLPET